MRSITGTWFECTCQYGKQMEDGAMKKVKETSTINAMSFSEAETRFIDEMKDYNLRDFDVTAIKIAPYKEIFFDDTEESDYWYKVVLEFITIDEKTEKEKRTKTTYLFQAQTFEQAKRNVVEAMHATLTDYSIAKIEETKIMYCFDYAAK